MRNGVQVALVLLAVSPLMWACDADQTSTQPPPPLLYDQGELPLAPDDAMTAAGRRGCLTDEARVDLPVVLQDRRDHGDVQIIFADQTAVVWCLVTRSQDGGSSISSGSSERQAASASLTVEGGFGPHDSVGIMGRVAESARVVRILAGGRVIEASHRDGFYAASWRGSDLPTLVVAYDDADRLIGTLDQVALGEFFIEPH